MATTNESTKVNIENYCRILFIIEMYCVNIIDILQKMSIVACLLNYKQFTLDEVRLRFVFNAMLATK